MKVSNEKGFEVPVRTPAVEIRGVKAEDFLPEGGVAGKGREGCVRLKLATDLRAASARFGVRPKDLALVSGAEGGPDLTELVASYGVRLSPEGVLPFCGGALRANPGLTIVGLLPHSTGSGLGRWVDTARADVDITCLVVNGGCGQAGATYDPELASFAETSGAGLIARLRPGEEGAADILFAALQHKGFSWIDCVGLCPVCGSEGEATGKSGILSEKEPATAAGGLCPVALSTALTSEERERLWDLYR